MRFQTERELPFCAGRILVETRRDPKLAHSAFQASPDHQSVSRLVDEEGTGDAREGGRADEDGDLLVTQKTQSLDQFELMTHRSGSIFRGSHCFKRSLHEVRYGFLAAG